MVKVRVRCVINKICTESKLTLKSCLLFYYYAIIFDPIKGFGCVGYKLKHTVDVHMIRSEIIKENTPENTHTCVVTLALRPIQVCNHKVSPDM